LLFSNDTQPNKLYRNNGNGRLLKKLSSPCGVQRRRRGARREWAVDTADYDRSGNTQLLITTSRTKCFRSITRRKRIIVDESATQRVGRGFPASRLGLDVSFSTTTSMAGRTFWWRPAH